MERIDRYRLCFAFCLFRHAAGLQSSIGYVAMVAAMGLLAFASIKLGSVYALLIGNIASFAVSFYFVGNMHGDTLAAFFKPLSSEQTLIFLSVLMLILQAVVAGITYWIILRKRRAMNPYRMASRSVK
ncbi:hypothetical protein [Saccharibacillus endophyticus]|nr:hypothetical protein [Saccharibacillus endophyticus]